VACEPSGPAAALAADDVADAQPGSISTPGAVATSWAGRVVSKPGTSSASGPAASATAETATAAATTAAAPPISLLGACGADESEW
jgi:hypothetical protein